MSVPQKQEQNLPTTHSENDIYDYYSSAGQALTGSRIVGHLLRFTKYGEYKAGQDEVIVPIGTELIAHMGELLLGWQKWQDNKPVEQNMGLMRELFKPPKREELGDLDHALWEVDTEGKERDPWQKTSMLIFKGADDDELYTFSTSSFGGLAAIGKLMNEYGRGARMRPNQMPVVKLGWSQRTHSNKQIGDYRVPIFTITRWVDRKEIDAALNSAEQVEGGGDSVEQLPLNDPPAKTRADPKSATRF